MAVNREYWKVNNLIDCWDLLKYHSDKNTGITRGKTMLEDLKGNTALVTTLNLQLSTRSLQFAKEGVHG